MPGRGGCRNPNNFDSENFKLANILRGQASPSLKKSLKGWVFDAPNFVGRVTVERIIELCQKYEPKYQPKTLAR